MENAKKFYLVDERTYNNTKSSPWQQAISEKFQETSWSKPPEKRSKTERHRDMQSLLECNDMSDDQKAKLYTQQFIRFQNTNKGAEMPPFVIKPEPVVDLPSVTAKRSKKRKKKLTKNKIAESPELSWESSDDETESSKIASNKKKSKLRRSSRVKKPIKWDVLYNV